MKRLNYLTHNIELTGHRKRLAVATETQTMEEPRTLEGPVERLVRCIMKFQGIEVTNEKPEIITLCGSSRFCQIMAVLAWEFEKQGKIALGLHLLPDWYCKDKGYIPDDTGHIHHIGEQEGVEDIMDTLHFKKIEMADMVYVVNVDGYIGSSTVREIAYAKQLGKRIVYYDSVST